MHDAVSQQLFAISMMTSAVWRESMLRLMKARSKAEMVEKWRPMPRMK
ncbi:hypothetical protein PO124_07740 [Bacillus licheniformis]|nr:hypothetical protein [Bacillus licheniformis]